MKKFYSLIAVAALASVSFGQQRNLVENPGFETGALAPWAAGWTSSYTAPNVSTTEPRNGSYNAIYNATATTGFFQNIPVTARTEYTVSFWYKATGSGSGARIWSLFYTDPENTQVTYLTGQSATDPLRNNNGFLTKSATWTEKRVTFTSPAGVNTLQLAVRAYSNSTVSFDDFSLVEGTLSTVDQNDFQKKVKMNTIISDKLVITLPSKSTVNIYTINGQLVSSDRVDVGQSINTQSLSKGVYIVSVENGTSKFTQKVVKK